jgi:hypothetical protein
MGARIAFPRTSHDKQVLIECRKAIQLQYSGCISNQYEIWFPRMGTFGYFCHWHMHHAPSNEQGCRSILYFYKYILAATPALPKITQAHSPAKEGFSSPVCSLSKGRLSWGTIFAVRHGRSTRIAKSNNTTIGDIVIENVQPPDHSTSVTKQCCGENFLCLRRSQPL